MKLIRVNSIRCFFILLAMVVSLAGEAQKRKRSADDGSPVGIRLREAEFYFTEGEKFFILEDYAKALVYYQRALDINPDNGTIHYKIADVLSKSNKQDDLSKAALSIEQALKLDQSNKYFYVLAATIYNSLGKFDRAADAYEKMIQKVPGTEEYLYELAAVYQYAGKQDEAIKAYTRAEDFFGLNEVSSIQKLKIYLEAGKNAEAIAEGERLIKAFPDEGRYVMALSELLSKNGLGDQAVKYLEDFISRNPDAGNVQILLAGFYRDMGLEEKARPLLLALFENPDVEISNKLVVLGAYNAELNQNKNKAIDTDKASFAASLYEKLKSAHPTDANVTIIGGDLYLSTGKDREAHAEYLKAVEGGAQVNFEVYQNLLYLGVKLEQWDQVIKHAEEALEIYPNQAMIHYFNGIAHLRKRMYDEAIFSFEQVKRLASTNNGLLAEVNSQLGEAYHATQNYQQSDKSYDEALSLNPNNSVALNNYSYYLALRKENLEKAEKMSGGLVKNHPENPTFLDTHAWVLYSREKYKEARKFIERAISTGKATATHFEHYGDILFKLGDVDGAVRQWEKARGMNANSETLDKKIANRKIYE